eukprot:NODE_254_length_2086_cov_93.621502_g171_i0.p1 GENE.NODE_254_length_2086_cov_93.621502_g171_i0~~NODE_254_length_2086_cov_93.621502_g171_i0.p1  ORF type:complete len:489 (+),score=85.04 NODE_254_length_2086_cov_93.621502_g171_i0:63-1529(+)
MTSYGAGVWIVLVVYLLALGCAAFYARWRNRPHTQTTRTAHVTQHYLAGKGMGRLVLTASTLASLFSGYTVAGIPAEAHARGWFAFRWVGIPISVGLSTAFLAPRLHWLGRERKYTSCLDLIYDRYTAELISTRVLHFGVLVCMVVPLIIASVAQFTAFGATIEGLSGNAIPSWVAGLGLVAILVPFESFGGLLGVSLTDLVQAGILVFGCVMTFVSLREVFGGMSSVGLSVRIMRPEFTATLPLLESMEWLNLWIVSFGAPFMPHILTRILAAKDVSSMRIATQSMFVAPFLVNGAAVLVGMVGSALFADAEGNEVYALFVGKLLDYSSVYYVVGSLMLSASVAAIMSTTDSMLISLSHMVTLHLIVPLRPNMPTSTFKIVGGCTTAVTAVLCMLLSELKWNLSSLILFQYICLIHCAPTYLFGMYSTQVTSLDMVGGLLVGVCSGVVMEVLAVPMAGVLSLLAPPSSGTHLPSQPFQYSSCLQAGC